MGLLRNLAKTLGLSKRSYHPGDPVLAEWLGVGAETEAGVTVTPNSARQCPEVDACIGLIEDTIATVPLDLFERTGEGARARRDDHPLHRLLHDKPNDWQTSAEFRQMMEGWRETHGNAYARIIPNGEMGFPAALEPMHPDYMAPFRGPNGGVFFRHTPADGPARTFTQGEILHLRDRPARRTNLLEGESKVTRHREAIGRAMATGNYLSQFFAGAGMPKIALILPAGVEVDEPQKKKLVDQFMRRHGNTVQMKRPAVLDAGIDVKQLGTNNDDAQVIQAYEQSVAQIARVFGVPLHLIGETSKVTSWGTGIEQQSIGFVVYYMRPKFVVWEQALNRALMSADTRKRFYFEFNIDGLLRGDFKSRMDGFALLIQWSLASPNEIRRLLNFPPVDGGDERLAPLNMVPASRIMDVLLKSGSGNERRDADWATAALAAMISGKANGHMEGVTQ